MYACVHSFAAQTSDCCQIIAELIIDYCFVCSRDPCHLHWRLSRQDQKGRKYLHWTAKRGSIESGSRFAPFLARFRGLFVVVKFVLANATD